MTGLELVGAAALYIVGLIASCYALLAVMSVLNSKRGLEAIPAIIIPPALLAIVGAIVGLVLLGVQIGHTQ